MKRPEDFERRPWFIVPVTPGRERIMRRWNIALISALIFIVMGVFAMTMTPELGHAAAGYHRVPLKIDENPARVQNLTPNIAQDLGISSATYGVVVTSVDPSGPAAAAGLHRGDVIQEVNRKPVHNVNQYQQALAEDHGQSVLLLINRGRSTHYLVVQPQ